MIRRRLAVMALGTAASYLSKWAAERSVNGATQRFEDRLPPPVSRVINALPGDLMRVGGTAMVAGSAARSAGRAGRRAVTVASAGTSTFLGRKATVDRLFADAAGTWRQEVEGERRRLRSDLLRCTRGAEAAVNALLDLRVDADLDAHTDLPPMLEPVPAGRRRPLRLAAPLVERVQRSYRPPVKPWDVPSRDLPAQGPRRQGRSGR
ncbi:MAG: hypothetical protein O3C27_17445 [Actinomycetota bacterium]|nr:hypothetical protein [Actinomycetota bacterium]